jgi:hypothetical protein
MPRSWKFGYDLAAALKQLVLLEEYQAGENIGELKGKVKLQKTLEPAIIKQFIPTKKTTSEGSSNSKTLPKLPVLPKLPQLPKLQ